MTTTMPTTKTQHHQCSTEVSALGITLFIGRVPGRANPPDFDMYKAIPTTAATATTPATAPPMTPPLIPELDSEFELPSRHVTESEGVVVEASVYGLSVRRSNL